MYAEDDEEKSFCYIEGSSIDKSATTEVSELHENVWYRMRPPKQRLSLDAPFVSARQIDLIRNTLLGKTALKSSEPKPECAAKEASACRRDVAKQPCLKMRKSSVRFLNETAFDDFDNLYE